MEMTTNNGRELSLGRPKGGRLVEVPILFYNYFRTLITGRLIGGRLEIEVQLYFAKQRWYGILETPRSPAGVRKWKRTYDFSMFILATEILAGVGEYL